MARQIKSSEDKIEMLTRENIEQKKEIEWMHQEMTFQNRKIDSLQNNLQFLMQSFQFMQSSQSVNFNSPFIHNSNRRDKFPQSIHE